MINLVMDLMILFKILFQINNIFLFYLHISFLIDRNSESLKFLVRIHYGIISS